MSYSPIPHFFRIRQVELVQSITFSQILLFFLVASPHLKESIDESKKSAQQKKAPRRRGKTRTLSARLVDLLGSEQAVFNSAGVQQIFGDPEVGYTPFTVPRKCAWRGRV